MKITIDTAHDSKSDIAKAIEFLKRFIGEGGGDNDYTPDSEATSAFGSMFGDSDSQSTIVDKKDEEDDDDKPTRIEMY